MKETLEKQAGGRRGFSPVKWVSSMRTQLAHGEDAGYFGPTSALWHVNREAFLGMGLGRAVLMQVAHPWVAQAVSDHSSVDAHPIERFLGTIEAAEFLTFGSRAQADATAARLNDMHAHIHGELAESVGRWRRGDKYQATDTAALLWVLVTLIDTTFVMHEICFGRMPPKVEREYVADTARLGAMLGIPSEMVPPDRSAIQNYMHDRIGDGTVAVGDVGLKLGRDLINREISLGTLFRPYQSLTSIIAVGLLPPDIRSMYGFRLSRRDRLFFVAGRRLAGTVPRLLPRRVRTDPIAWEAIKRSSVA